MVKNCSPAMSGALFLFPRAPSISHAPGRPGRGRPYPHSRYFRMSTIAELNDAFRHQGVLIVEPTASI